MLRQLLERSRREDVQSYHIALIYAVLGEHDQAFTYLGKSFEDHDVELCCLKVDPMLDKLREDARFDSLLRRVGFTA